jgi:MFS transporter, ACS family, D-galactonate transporter
MIDHGARLKAWLIVALLFGFMLINFADKAIIGLAGVPIMKELGLTPQQYGFVGSSFFFLFSISAVLMGFLANRVKTKWLLFGMSIVWAVMQFPMIGAVTLPMLITCRVMLGAGEGPAYPVALHATYKWFPNAERTLPTAVIAQGSAVGVVLALPALEWVIERFSWHWAFGVLGCLGALWAITWLVLGQEGNVVSSVEADGGPGHSVPYRELICNPTTLANFAAGFGAFWGQSLLLAWFTPFLVTGLGYTGAQAAWITTIPWAVSPVMLISAGFISQRLVMRGVPTRSARGLLSGACVSIGGSAMLAMQFMPTDSLKILMIVIGFALPAVIYVMGHAMVSEYTPPQQRGAMIAINNAVSTSAGIVGPFVMGSVIHGSSVSAADYGRGYAIAGAVCLLGGLIGLLFLRPEAERHRFTRLRSALPAWSTVPQPLLSTLPRS